jgi:TonB family protein
MIKLTATIGLAILCMATLAPARADSLSDGLNQDFKNHVLGVRYPIHDGDQQFDRDGHPVNAGAAQEWEVYGGILIDKLSLKNDQLLVTGMRVAPSNRVENGKPVMIPLGKNLNFDIHLDHPLASMDEARKVLDSVFYLDEKDVEHRKPELRRTRDSTENQVVSHSLRLDEMPRHLYAPEPEFTEAARKAKFQGVVSLNVVIDTRGTISDMKIERGLGLGLDEKAFDCLKKWRFAPATRNGEPVNIPMHVEINFHLY